MNLFRHNPNLEPLRDGTQKGDVLYFRCQWHNAGQLHKREGSHLSSVFRHPENPNLLLTPYVYEYFKGVLSTGMPENSKIKNIVVATDLDAKFWHADNFGPPSGAFDAVIDPLYAKGGLEEGGRLWGFFEKAFVQNMRHMPRALFFNEEFSTALVVLSAIQSTTYHLKEMAGIGCLSEFNIDSGEMHDAMMRHEWFHLSEDAHLSDVQIEIEADKAALDGIQTKSLKQAWIDTRIVGGFMWPFPGRQNGIPLIDDSFSKKAKQEIQMNIVYEWCDQVFKEFYDSVAASDLVSHINEGIMIDGSTLPKDLQEFFEAHLYTISRYEREEIETVEEFENWFKAPDDKALGERAWKYLTQSYMMKLQVSNMGHPEFYSAMYNLSDRIAPSSEELVNTKAKVHDYFRKSLKRLLPDVVNKKVDFRPEWAAVQIPNINYRSGPYIGERPMSFSATTFSAS